MIKFENGDFLLQNEFFSRTLRLDGDGLRTVSCRLGEQEYIVENQGCEFSFFINGTNYSGYRQGSQKLQYKSYEILKGEKDAEILNITFELPEEQGSVTIISVIYPDLAGTVRFFRFDAAGKELDLTDLTLDTLNLAPRNPVNIQIFREQGRIPALPQFTITGSDDMIRCHDEEAQYGYFAGSSIPGPLRYVMCYPHWATGIRYGYSQTTPVFRKYIAPGESWTSAELFLLFYNGTLADCGGRNDFRELVRRSMPELTPVAGPMYCTWIPFLKNISEGLVSEVAAAAKEAGFDILVLDDGWFVDGKWQVDAEKFPNGLEAVSADVRSKGLKFGLWFNIGTDYGDVGSAPETNCILPDGRTKSGGVTNIRCFASAHRENVAEKLKSLAADLNLSYFKMDFSNIISPYGVQRVGCCSTDHAWHRDVDDAVIEEYRSMYVLREYMKAAFPEVCLDYSFEVFGTEFPGIAGLQYSDIQHVSNLHVSPCFYDARKIREAIYAFTAMLPPERVSGTLIELQGGSALLNLYTAMAGNPLMAGDLRTLSSEEKQASKNVFDNFRAISAKGALTDMQLFDFGSANEPSRIPDGYFRWSRTSGQGMAAVFANNSKLESTVVSFAIPDDAPRTLRDMATNELIGTYTAAELKKGIELSFNGCAARGFVLEK